MNDTAPLSAEADDIGGTTGETTAPPVADRPMRPARPPLGIGSAPLVAQLIALALVVLGGVGIQEALVRSGLLAQSSWTTGVLDAVDGLASDSPLVLVVAIVLGVLGLVLLPVAFLRRPRTSVALSAETGVYLRRRDLAPILRTALEGTESVTDASVRVRGRRVRVSATTVASRDRAGEVKAALTERVERTLSAVDRAPRTRITLRHLEGTR